MLAHLDSPASPATPEGGDYILTHDKYLALRACWRTLMNARTALSPAQHLVYAVLLGRDWRKGFTPPTNPTTVANGGFYDWGLWTALMTIRFSALGDSTALLAPFTGIVTPAHLARVQARLPEVTAFPVRHIQPYTPEQYAPGVWPFPAYQEERACPAPPAHLS